MTHDTRAAALQFDPDALRDKYRQEREKRLRADGNAQYLEVTGQFAHYLEIPMWRRIVREPLTDEVQVLVIGGGFASLLIGAPLLATPPVLKTFVWSKMAATSAAPGIGTAIRAPRATQKPTSTCRCSKRPATCRPKNTRRRRRFAHSRRIAKHYDLYRNVLFQTRITELRWDETRGRWVVSTIAAIDFWRNSCAWQTVR